jgi:hypothetical protein
MGRVRRFVDVAEPCPCGSGKTYGLCCVRKDFTFERDARGEIVKSIKLSGELIERLREQKERFREVFGRLPKHTDRVIFESYLYSEDEFHSTVMELADAVGLSEEVKYATEVTRRIVSEENINRLTDLELGEWNAAIANYRKIIKSGGDPFGELSAVPDSVVEHSANLLRGLQATICHLGSFLEKIPRNRRMDESAFLQYYFAARSLDTVRTIFYLFSERYSDDVLALVRTVYENFLRIMYLRGHPNKAGNFIAMHGVTVGTHEFPKNRAGKVDRQTIIDRKTGEKFEARISNRRMAAASDIQEDLEFYDGMYPLLSTQVHGTLDTYLTYATPTDGFKIHIDHNPFFGLHVVSLVNAMLLDELSKIRHITKVAKRDTSYMAQHLKRSLLELGKQFDKVATVRYPIQLLLRRAMCIGG